MAKTKNAIDIDYGKEPKFTDKSIEILDRSWELIHSVEYEVTGRWLFYIIQQEGWYDHCTGKDARTVKWNQYQSFNKLLTKARMFNFQDWRLDTLVDDSRNPYVVSPGFRTVNERVQEIPNLADYVQFSLDHWYQQRNYVMFWTEANAMLSQFRYYSDDLVSVWPMGGQRTLPMLDAITKNIKQVWNRYRIPIKVLYFGDCDNAGNVIYDRIRKDVSYLVQRDCSFMPFDIFYCGLTQGQAEEFGVPENFEKPGQYQWEAINDEAAGEMIQMELYNYISPDVIQEVQAKGEKAKKRWQPKVRRALDAIIPKYIKKIK